MRLPVSAPFAPYLCVLGVRRGEDHSSLPQGGCSAACEPKPEPGLDTGYSPSADSEVEGDGKLLDLSEQQGIVGEPPGEKSQKTASL